MNGKEIDLIYARHIDIVNGNKAYIQRLLSIRGCSDSTIYNVMEKIETIIEHSGKLGRVIQREKDDKFIEDARTKMWAMQNNK